MRRTRAYAGIIRTIRSAGLDWVADEIEAEFIRHAAHVPRSGGSEGPGKQDIDALDTERHQVAFAVAVLENTLIQPIRMHVDAVTVFEAVRRDSDLPQRVRGPAVRDTERREAPYRADVLKDATRLADRLEEVCDVIRAAHNLPGPNRGGPDGGPDGGTPPPDKGGPGPLPPPPNGRLKEAFMEYGLLKALKKDVMMFRMQEPEPVQEHEAYPAAPVPSGPGRR